MAAPGTVMENTSATHNTAAEHGPVVKEDGSVGPPTSVDPVKGKNLSRVVTEVIPHVMNLYQCVATESDYGVYSPAAEFEDPLMHAKGLKQIQSAFQAMPKTFSVAQALKAEVTQDLTPPTVTSGEILMDLLMEYKLRPLGPTFKMPSVVRLVIQDGKVVRHEDRWHGTPLPENKSSLLSKAGDLVRRGNMMLTHALMGFGGKVPADSPESTLPAAGEKSSL